MPLFVVRPTETLITNTNIGDTREAQISNGVVDPDPVEWHPDGKLVGGVRLPYEPGDQVSSLGSHSNPRTGRGNVYVFLADDGTGAYGTTPETMNTFVPSPQSQGRRNEDAIDPDVEQESRTNPFSPDRRNPFWSPRRKINALTFNDERPFVKVTRSDNEDGLTFRLNTTGVGNTIGFIDMEAASLEYTFSRNDRTVSNSIEFSDLDTIETWQEYFFKELLYPRHYLFRNIPTFAHREVLSDDEALQITMRNPGTTVSLGQIVFGFETATGTTVDSRGQSLEGLDFSFVGVDAYGTQTRTPRAATNTMKFTIEIDRDKTDEANRFFTSLKAGTPAIFFLSPNERLGTILYGWVRNFAITPKQGTDDKSEVKATIQGLV